FYSSLGAGGILGIYAGLYILSGVLTPFLKTPEELGQQAELKGKVA
ncbi:MFS transporter, partial [Salmonella enterica]|nr:MFS transporter [Salmonella enterica]EAY8198172.1 MFS transporter [Salmonella enterica]EBP5928591.1 MFS transporter [Salmonella enterica]